MIYRGMFEVQPFILPEKMFTVHDLDANCQDSVLKRLRDFMSTSSFYCYDIEYKSQRYVRGDLVVLKVISEVMLEVGMIEAFIVNDSNVFLAVNRFVVLKHLLGYYETESAYPDVSFIRIKDLIDFKPPIKHGTKMKFKFVLHHYVSHTFD